MNAVPTRVRFPISARIAQLLTEKIERGEFQPGEWLPTERELASEFGADRATIRAAIAYLAEQRLIVREPGRRPWINPDISNNSTLTVEADATNRSSQSTALQTIAAIIPQPPNYPALSLIQRGILRTLNQGGSQYRLIVFDNQGDIWARSVTLERQALEAIKTEGIAGAILWSIGGKETLPEIKQIQDRGIPLVLLDRRPDDFPCDFVGVDNFSAAYEAISYLCKIGHRRIAHITSAEAILTAREREQGYKEALLAHGIQPEEELIFRLQERDDLTVDIGPVLDHFSALPDPPSALFAFKDLLAHAFINEARTRGIKIPDDISVIGFDDHDRYGLQPPVLTTIHQPFESIGQHAARMLLRRLAQPKSTYLPYQHQLLPTPLVIRSTCFPFGEHRPPYSKE